MSTPHIDAAPGQIAATVLMPGDPLRARFVAQELLSDPEQVTERRNMLGFTGSWNGTPVSVMGSGMGIPSMSIYVTELVREYGVRRIIRIGTCGGLGDVAMGDVLLAQSASTDSRVNRMQFGGHDLSTCADYGLLRAAEEAAAAKGLPVRMANIFSTDCFYDGDPQILERLRRHRITGVEMEAAGLYGLAMREGFQALAILTVTDLFDTGERMPSEERERGLIQMAKLALACAV